MPIAPTILIAGLALFIQRGHPRLQPPLIHLDTNARREKRPDDVVGN